MYALSVKTIVRESMNRKILLRDRQSHLRSVMLQNELDIEDRLAICILENSIWTGDVAVE